MKLIPLFIPLKKYWFVICCLMLMFVLPVQAQDRIQWYSMKKAQQLARQHDKKVLIFAEASWCIYCKRMKKEVFPKQSVIDSMNAYFYPVAIDIESDKMMQYNGKKITQKQFARSFRVRATPTFFFIDSHGKKLGAQPGFIPAKTFSRLLGYIGSGVFQQMEFQQYLKRYVSN